jgi:PAS domain S-box-containing protein
MDSPDLQSTNQRPLGVSELAERVLESAPVIILLLDPAGLIQFVNPYFSGLTGYLPEDVQGKDWFTTCLPDRDREPTRHRFRGALAGSATRAAITPILTRAGGEREIEWSDEVQRDHSGEVRGLLCIGQDVTERLRTERGLREREQLLSTVVRGAPIVIFALDREGRFTLSDGKALSLIGLTPGQVVGQSAFELYADVPGMAENLRRALGGETVHYRTQVGSVWVDTTYSPRLRPDGAVDGVIGVAVDITAEKHAEAAVEQARDHLDAMLQALPDLLFEVGQDGRLFGFHARRLEQLAVPPEHFLGRTFHDVLPLAAADACLEAIRGAARDGNALGPIYELEMPGGAQWFEPSAARMASVPGAGPRFILLARDVTDRVRAERGRIASEGLFRTLAHAAPVGIYRIVGGRCVYANDRLCEITGLSREAAVTGGWWTCVHPDDLARTRTAWDLAARTGRPFASEYRCLRPDRGVVWVLSEARWDTGPDADSQSYVGTLTDVTDRVLAVEELRLSRGRLNEAQAIAQIGSWELDLRTGRLDWSDEIFRIFQIAPAEFGASYDAFLAAIHPDDRAQVNDAYTRSVSTHEPYTITHRLRMPGGAIKHVLERGETHYAADGAPLRSIGTVQDITERALAEGALAATREQLEATLQAIPDLLFEVDEGGRYLAVRAQRPELLAAPEANLVGRNVAEVLPTDGAEAVLDGIREAANAGCSFGRTFRLPLPGGSRWFELSISRKGSNQSSAPTYIVLSRDITARKQTERALIDSEARYRSVVEAMNDGIVVHAIDGAIVTANAAAERILGLTVDQMMGRTSMDPRWRSIRNDGSPFPGEEHPGAVTLRTGEPRTGVIMGVHKPSGELTWISITSRRITPLGEEGAYSVVASFADVTAQRQTDERLRASLHEKEALLKEVHHRVKNNLQIISSLLHLQGTRSADTAVRGLFEESRARVRAMALVHELLCQSDDLSRVDFAQYLLQVTTTLITTHQNLGVRMRVTVHPPDATLDIQVAIPCALITNELVTNILKYAFPGDEARGEIHVSFIQNADGGWVLSIADDGVGLPEAVNPHAPTTLGLRLVQTLASQVDAVMRVERTGGTRFELTFAR